MVEVQALPLALVVQHTWQGFETIAPLFQRVVPTVWSSS
jgi:hypothetical protein